MFTILLVFLIVMAGFFSYVARVTRELAEKEIFDKARDRVCKINGQYHQLSLDSKSAVAKLYVRSHRVIQAWRE